MSGNERQKRSSKLLPTRRDFVLSGLSLVAGIVIKAGVDNLSARYLPSAPDAEDRPPNAVYDGTIALYRGVNFRTSPRIPDRTRFSRPSNVIDWSIIHLVNGREILPFPSPYLDVFVVNNPELVEGQSTEDWGLASSFWIKLRVTLYDGTKDLPVYASLYGGGSYVQELAYTGEMFFMPGSRSDGISYKERGQVLIPSSHDRVARDTVPSIWAKKITAKLEGKIPLRPAWKPENGMLEDKGERIIPVAKIVADLWGTEEERRRMEEAQTPVNVRNYPETKYVNGEPVEILGVVKQGTEIINVLTDSRSYWSACRRGNIKGELYGQNGDKVDVDSNQIVAINNSYLFEPV